jgi:perosamine synthetase
MILDKLQDNGIGGRPGTHSITSLSVYREKFGTSPEQFPNSTMLDKQTLALPLHNHMVKEDVDRVVMTLRRMI